MGNASCRQPSSDTNVPASQNLSIADEPEDAQDQKLNIRRTLSRAKGAFSTERTRHPGVGSSLVKLPLRMLPDVKMGDIMNRVDVFERRVIDLTADSEDDDFFSISDISSPFPSGKCSLGSGNLSRNSALCGGSLNDNKHSADQPSLSGGPSSREVNSNPGLPLTSTQGQTNLFAPNKFKNGFAESPMFEPDDAQAWDEWSLPGVNAILESHQYLVEEDEANYESEPLSNMDGMNHEPLDIKVEIVDAVLAVFPDICRDYVSEIYENGGKQRAEELVEHILEKIDEGTQYPKAKDTQKLLKRKREVDEDEEAATKYSSLDRDAAGGAYMRITRTVLSGEFPHTPMTFITATLRQVQHHLFPAYRVLEEAERKWDPAAAPYNRIKHARKPESTYAESQVDYLLKDESTPADTMLALRELQAARRIRKKADDKRQAERQAQLDEEENTKRAERDGTMAECGCCFSDYPLNRMVHCNSEEELHWFCRNCARQTAENEIGNSKYHIRCMSTDGCKATFSHEQKKIFLDEKSIIALDRNEQEAVLRMAGIENLASCPFCPFAAEYPPVEEDRLFHCQAPDCEKVSCRLCKLQSHIPKTCEEFAKENGLSIRRQIEEAMSAAMIRKCNKCGTPFVKEEGCNKMTCTRNGCYNVQCYVCSKSCSYDHFNDKSRGGKSGNCPLFESVQERHDQEVNKAEKEALAKVRAEHPEYTDEDLKVKVSDKVKQDEENRKTAPPRGVLHHPMVPIVAGAFPFNGDIYQRMIQAEFNHQAMERVRYGDPQNQLPENLLQAHRADAQDRFRPAQPRGLQALRGDDGHVGDRRVNGFIFGQAPAPEMVIPEHPGRGPQAQHQPQQLPLAVPGYFPQLQFNNPLPQRGIPVAPQEQDIHTRHMEQMMELYARNGQAQAQMGRIQGLQRELAAQRQANIPEARAVAVPPQEPVRRKGQRGRLP